MSNLLKYFLYFFVFSFLFFVETISPDPMVVSADSFEEPSTFFPYFGRGFSSPEEIYFDGLSDSTFFDLEEKVLWYNFTGVETLGWTQIHYVIVLNVSDSGDVLDFVLLNPLGLDLVLNDVSLVYSLENDRFTYLIDIDFSPDYNIYGTGDHMTLEDYDYYVEYFRFTDYELGFMDGYDAGLTDGYERTGSEQSILLLVGNVLGAMFAFLIYLGTSISLFGFNLLHFITISLGVVIVTVILRFVL